MVLSQEQQNALSVALQQGNMMKVNAILGAASLSAPPPTTGVNPSLQKIKQTGTSYGGSEKTGFTRSLPGGPSKAWQLSVVVDNSAGVAPVTLMLGGNKLIAADFSPTYWNTGSVKINGNRGNDTLTYLADFIATGLSFECKRGVVTSTTGATITSGNALQQVWSTPDMTTKDEPVNIAVGLNGYLQDKNIVIIGDDPMTSTEDNRRFVLSPQNAMFWTIATGDTLAMVLTFNGISDMRVMRYPGFKAAIG